MSLAILFMFAPGAFGEPITVDRFIAPAVEEFDGLVALGYPDPYGEFAGEDPLPAPFSYRGVTYDTDDGQFIYASASPDCCLGAVTSFGAAIGTQTDTGFVDVTFDHSVTKAGGWVGISAGPVSFYGNDGVLLGTVLLSSEANDIGMTFRPQFAGWADTRGIKRVRFSDAMPNGWILWLDRITWESNPAPVPEPATGIALLGGLAAVVLRRRYMRQPGHRS
jgi:hypothetical protein